MFDLEQGGVIYSVPFLHLLWVKKGVKKEM